MSEWKHWDRRHVEGIEDDANYLICWKDFNERYSLPHRGYYLACDDQMFSLEHVSSHPIICDIYMPIPEAPK